MLDREARDVARGVDIGNAVYAAVRVDGNEPVDRLRDAVDRRSHEPWESDDSVGHNRSLGRERQLVVDDLARERTRAQHNSPLREEVTDRLARGRPEDLQRLRFRRDEPDLHAANVGPVEVGASEQRELVGRQRVDGAPRDHERNGLDSPPGEVAKEATNQLHVRGPAKRERAGYRGQRERSAGDEEQVVRVLGVSRRVRDVPPGVDADETRLREVRPELPRHLLELELHDLALLERSGDRQRPIREARLRGEKLEAHALLGNAPKRQRCLEGRDSTPHDQHPLLAIHERLRRRV